MFRPLPTVVSITGFAITGIVLGAGWKVGCYLADLATGDRKIDFTILKDVFGDHKTEEPLWRRQFQKFSQG
jgi:hypothetical protein